MKLRYAILMGLVNSLALGWLLGTYNGSVPPQGYTDLWQLLSWPTGNPLTLFAILVLIWTLCLLCVSWNKAAAQWWQWILGTFVLAGTLESAYWLTIEIYRIARK